jgi:type I restriction enzyme S subunit
MSELKKYKLGDVAQVIGGGTPSTTKEEYWNGEIGWLTPRDLTGYSYKYISKGERNITEEGLKNSSARLIPEGTVLMTSRAPIGYLAIAGKELCTNQGFKSFIVDEDKINNEYLYYLLKSNIDRIKSLGTGSTFAEVSASILKSFEIEIPDLPTQKEIASILSSLDEKIELNLQMNQTLEAMAQAIFKEWFVDFNFPGFDGELVDGLPKGWRMGKLGEEFNLIMGQSPPGTSYNEIGEGMVFYQGRTDFGFRFPTNRLYTTEPKRIAKPLDTLVSVRAPVGDINMANEMCCVGRGLSSVRHKSDAYSFTYYMMKNLEPVFNGFEGEGTVFGSINKTNFESIEIIVPSDEIVSEFEIVANPIDDKILENTKQIESLTQIRDTLLPKLMSGNIAVMNT